MMIGPSVHATVGFRVSGHSADDTGGFGNDTFYFGANSVRDTVTDFTHGQNVLDMSAYGSGLTSINQLVIADSAQGVSVAFGGSSILLLGMHNLGASDFHFMV